MPQLDCFTHPRAIVGMIHVPALPGTPRCASPLAAVVEHAAHEARLYTRCGVDGLMIENMHDVPYLSGAVGPEIVAAMTAVGLAVRQTSQLPLGVQILAAANEHALAVALATGAAFIRVENFAYAHVADEGLMPTASAGTLLRYRRQIGATHVRILADVKKKHASHALTADVSLRAAAETTAFFGADALVITGTATGQPCAIPDLHAARSAVTLPLCVGSGVTDDNLAQFWPCADVFIVGSAFKAGGLWSNSIDEARVQQFMNTVRALRNT